MVCAQKGYSLVVTIAENFSVERRKLLRCPGGYTRARALEESTMNILQQPLLIASVPVNYQIVLGVLFVVAAVTLFCLSIDAGVSDSVYDGIKIFMKGEYWVRRLQRRFWIFRSSGYSEACDH
jgi:hypothetical protein